MHAMRTSSAISVAAFGTLLCCLLFMCRPTQATFSVRTGTDQTDRAYGVAWDKADTGSVYVTGSTNGDLGGSNAGSSDVFLASFNSTGFRDWVVQFGTSGEDIGIGAAYKNGVYVAGYTTGNLNGTHHGGLYDIFLAKYDATGVRQWLVQNGTSKSDMTIGMAADSDGNAYVRTSLSLWKYNKNGTYQWVLDLSFSVNAQVQPFHTICYDGSGHIFITGGTSGTLSGTSAGQVDVYLAKYNGAGGQQWVVQTGSSRSDWGMAVTTDGFGNAYVAGATYGAIIGTHIGSANGVNMFLMKYNSNGVQQWATQLGTGGLGTAIFPGDVPYAVAVNDAGNEIAVVGNTWGPFGGTPRGLTDLFVVRFDGMGNKVWAYQDGSPVFDHANDVQLDGNGSIIAVGELNGDVFVTAPPGVIAVHPMAQTDGTSTVTIVGNNFGVMQPLIVNASVAGLPCGSTEWLSATALLCKGAPAMAGAGLDVRVMIDHHASQQWPKFNYMAPTVISVSPAASRSDISTVTIIGSNFGPGDTVITATYNNVRCTAPTWLSQTSMRCTSGGGSGQSLPVVVTAAGQSSAPAYVFDYEGESEAWVIQAGTPSQDQAFGVAIDASNNVYVAGVTTGALNGSNAGGHDIFLAKYNVAREQTWVVQDGTTGEDHLNAVAVDCGGGIVTTGSSSGMLGDEKAGKRDVILIRYSDSGAKEWVSQMGTAEDDLAYGLDVDVNGNALVVGSTRGDLNGTNAGGEDLFLLKHNRTGSMQWVVQFGTSGDDVAYAVATDSVGDSYIVGSTTGALVGSHAGAKDVFLIQYNGAGTRLWGIQKGGTSDDIPSDIVVDSGGNSFVVGYTRGIFSTGTNAGGADIFLFKCNSTGSTQWVVQAGSASEDRARGVAIFEDTVLIAGTTGGELAGPRTHAGFSDVFINKHNVSSGLQLWTHMAGTAASDSGMAVAVNSAGTAHVVGHTAASMSRVHNNAGGSDFFILGLPLKSQVCRAGYYTGLERKQCAPCPYGTYQENPESTSCTPCPPGHTTDSNGMAASTGCRKCDRGQYVMPYDTQNSSQDRLCSICPRNRFGNTTGLMECFSCPPHTYHPRGLAGGQTDATKCAPCAPGEYAFNANPDGPTPASAMCEKCPVGRFSNRQKLTSVADCDYCPDGYGANLHAKLGARYANETCEPCPAGSFSRESRCFKCPGGTYSRVPGARCLECAENEFVSGEGNTVCQKCPEGSVTVQVGSSTLSQCVCQKGFYGGKRSDLRNFRCRPCNERMSCTENGLGKPDVSPGYWLCVWLAGSSRCQDPAELITVVNGSSVRPLQEMSSWLGDNASPVPFGEVLDDHEYKAYRCIPHDACFNGECTTGYQGSACSECMDGYYREDGECKSCNESEGDWPPSAMVTAMLMVSISSAAAAALLGHMCSNMKPHFSSGEGVRRDSGFGAAWLDRRVYRPARTGLVRLLIWLLLMCRGRCFHFKVHDFRIADISILRANIQQGLVRLIRYMQLLGVLMTIDIAWPDVFDLKLSWAIAFGADLFTFRLEELFQLGCASPEMGAGLYGAGLISRLLAGLVVGIVLVPFLVLQVCCMRRKCRPCVKCKYVDTSNHALQSLLTIYSIAYVSLHAAATDVIGCLRRDDGDENQYFLVSEPRIQCYSAAESSGILDSWPFLTACGVIGFVLFSLGIPIVLACAVYSSLDRHGMRLDNAKAITSVLRHEVESLFGPEATESLDDRQDPRDAIALLERDLNMLDEDGRHEEEASNNTCSTNFRELIRPDVAFLVSPYCSKYAWWEVILLLYRMLAVFNVILSALGADYQIIYMVLVTLFFLVLHCLALPYKDPVDNLTEALVQFALFVTALVGLVHHAGDDSFSDPAQDCLSVLMFGSHIVASFALVYIPCVFKSLERRKNPLIAEGNKQEMSFEEGSPPEVDTSLEGANSEDTTPLASDHEVTDEDAEVSVDDGITTGTEDEDMPPNMNDSTLEKSTPRPRHHWSQWLPFGRAQTHRSIPDDLMRRSPALYTRQTSAASAGPSEMALDSPNREMGDATRRDEEEDEGEYNKGSPGHKLGWAFKLRSWLRPEGEVKHSGAGEP